MEKKAKTETTLPTAPKKAKGGYRAARRAKYKAARANDIRGGKKVRTRKVQAKKDANVKRNSHGAFSTVADMQKAGGIDPKTGRRPGK